MPRKMIWIDVDGCIHKEYKAVLKLKGEKKGVKFLEQKELGKIMDRNMKRIVNAYRKAGRIK